MQGDMINDDEKVRAIFRDNVGRRRRHERWLFGAFAVFVVSVLAASLDRSWAWRPMGWLPFLAWLVTAGLIVLAPPLMCGCCNKTLDKALARYCPECGADAIERPGPHKLAVCDHCASCHRTLTRGRRRSRRWKIRFCTYCGALLDETGV